VPDLCDMADGSGPGHHRMCGGEGRGKGAGGSGRGSSVRVRHRRKELRESHELKQHSRCETQRPWSPQEARGEGIGREGSPQEAQHWRKERPAVESQELGCKSDSHKHQALEMCCLWC
jgi:hypothetical protein